MQVVSRRSLADSLAEDYRKAFENHGADGGGWWVLHKEIYDRMVALGEHPTVEAVEAAGRGGWSNIKCGECNQRVEAVIVVDHGDGYESHTTTICLKCLKMAVVLVEAEISP